MSFDLAQERESGGCKKTYAKLCFFQNKVLRCDMLNTTPRKVCLRSANEDVQIRLIKLPNV